MTREEIKIAALRDREIKIAASNYVEENSVNGYEAISSHRDSFIEGADWSDKNPVNVWHDVSEEPKINEDVVLYDCCGNFIAEFFDGSVTWRNIVLYYKATIWAYVKDLLPKGGEL